MREALIRLLTSTSSRHRPWQISAAVAIGVLGGLLPKTCLLFYALLAVVYCLPVHLPIAIATLLLISPIAVVSQPQLGQVGVHALMHSSWSQFWLRLDSYPLVPWLSLHNSLVNGCALVGTAMLVPAYVVARMMVAVIIPAESLAIRSQVRQEHKLQEVLPLTTAVPTTIETPNTITKLERILASYDAMHEAPSGGFDEEGVAGAADADRVIRRAALMVSAVDDILSVIQAEESASVRQSLSPSPSLSPAPVEQAEMPLRERVAAKTAENDFNRREDDAHPTSHTAHRGANSNTNSDISLTDAVASGPTSRNRFDAPQEGDQPLSSIQTQPYQKAETSIAIVRGPGASPNVFRPNEPQEGVQGAHFRGAADIRSSDVRNKETVVSSPVASRTNPNPAGGLVSQHSSHSAVVPKPNSVASHDRQSAVRDVREGEVLRNLLNHLRELKEKV